MEGAAAYRSPVVHQINLTISLFYSNFLFYSLFMTFLTSHRTVATFDRCAPVPSYPYTITPSFAHRSFSEGGIPSYRQTVIPSSHEN